MSVTGLGSVVNYPLGSPLWFPERARHWGEVVVLAIIYVALARLGQQLAISPGNITPVWFPSGFIFAALLLRGFYLWPGIFLGALIGNGWAYTSPDDMAQLLTGLGAGLFNGIGDVFCGCLGAYMMRRQLRLGEPFFNVSNCLYFMLYAVIAGALISAVFGILGLVGFGILQYEQWQLAFTTWFTGDAVGILLLGSLALAWYVPRDVVLTIVRPAKAEYLSFIVLALCLLLLNTFYFYDETSQLTGLPLMLLLPLLAWSILRLGLRWTFLMVTFTGCIAVLVFAMKADVPAAQISQNLIILQSFVAMLTLTVWLITAVTYQWADSYQLVREARQQAEDSNRFKSRFLAAVSQELRSPMNGFVGYTELLRGTDLTDLQSGYVDGIEKSAAHMTTLVGELSELANAESKAPEHGHDHFSPLALLDEMSEIFSRHLNSDQVQLCSRLDEELPLWLIGDRQRIHQVMHNFLSNACKHTTQGTITAAVQKISDSRVRFAVRDSGPGIDQRLQARIFEPFAHHPSGDYQKMGSGLGLYICSRLVHSMQGEIGLSSTPGEGSCFWFEIPLQEGTALLTRERTTLEQQQGQLHLRVLVAEDNIVSRKLIGKMLKHQGCQVTLVNNGEEARVVAAEQEFDVILMDCMMPVMDGFTAARMIRQSDGLNRQTPIVALTANVLRENRDRCFAAGMDEFISKPVSIAGLYACLSALSDTAAE